ncbi:hypothetical protein V2A60_009164 [Cordyceps javanica]
MSTSISTTLVSLPTTAASSSTRPVVNGTSLSAGANATATSNATILFLPQLTTQFVPSSQCTPVPNWTPPTVPITLGDSQGNTTYSQLLLPVTDAQFSACQPSGWDNINSTYRLSFSKAACPSGYNYNQLSDLFNNQPNTETILTTAYCCPSGFSFSMFYNTDIISISGAYCLKTTTLASTTQTTTAATSTTTTTTSSTTTTVSNSATGSAAPAARNATASATMTRQPSVVTMFYPPWYIAWEKRDASELSPSPPTVSVQFPVKTWEPGTEIDPSLARKRTDPNALDKGMGQIIGIVVGCVVALFAIISAITIFMCMRSRRRERAAFEREEHQLQEQRLQRIGEYHRSRSPTDDEPLPVYVKSREQDKATVAGLAVPPYKERPSSDSSRHSHRQDHQHAHTAGGRNDLHEDTDGLALHDQHTLENTAQQSSTQTHTNTNRRRR